MGNDSAGSADADLSRQLRDDVLDHSGSWQVIRKSAFDARRPGHMALVASRKRCGRGNTPAPKGAAVRPAPPAAGAVGRREDLPPQKRHAKYYVMKQEV